MAKQVDKGPSKRSRMQQVLGTHEAHSMQLTTSSDYSSPLSPAHLFRPQPSVGVSHTAAHARILSKAATFLDLGIPFHGSPFARIYCLLPDSPSDIWLKSHLLALGSLGLPDSLLGRI